MTSVDHFSPVHKSDMETRIGPHHGLPFHLIPLFSIPIHSTNTYVTNESEAPPGMQGIKVFSVCVCYWTGTSVFLHYQEQVVGVLSLLWCSDSRGRHQRMEHQSMKSAHVYHSFLLEDFLYEATYTKEEEFLQLENHQRSPLCWRYCLSTFFTSSDHASVQLLVWRSDLVNVVAMCSN